MTVTKTDWERIQPDAKVHRCTLIPPQFTKVE